MRPVMLAEPAGTRKREPDFESSVVFFHPVITTLEPEPLTTTLYCLRVRPEIVAEPR